MLGERRRLEIQGEAYRTQVSRLGEADDLERDLVDDLRPLREARLLEG